MGAKIKGFFKGFKYISQIFVYKEHEMEIGYPTDVRHVAHIGWDGSSMNAPSWMSEFRTASDFSSASLSNMEQSRETSWTSQDFEQVRGFQAPAAAAAIFSTATTLHPPDIPKAPKNTKRKKKKKGRPPSPASSRASSFATALDGAEELPGETRVI